MKIEIWNDPREEEEPITRLKLDHSGMGKIYLRVVDEYGEKIIGGILAEISADGIRPITGVDACFGIALNDENRVVIARD